MHDEVATKCIAACTGLSGFVVALLSNAFVDNPIETAVPRAIVAMVACAPLGYVIGYIATSMINDAIMRKAELAKEATRAAAERKAAETRKQAEEQPLSA